jgi:hypothetical protein
MTSLRFAERYALVDEETFNRYAKNKSVASTPAAPTSAIATPAVAAARSERALRANLDNPFMDATQKALAHSQLMREYLSDVARLKAVGVPAAATRSAPPLATTTATKTDRGASPPASPHDTPPDTPPPSPTDARRRLVADGSRSRSTKIPRTVGDRRPAKASKKKRSSDGRAVNRGRSLPRALSPRYKTRSTGVGRQLPRISEVSAWQTLKRPKTREEDAFAFEVGDDDDDDDDDYEEELFP